MNALFFVEVYRYASDGSELEIEVEVSGVVHPIAAGGCQEVFASFEGRPFQLTRDEALQFEARLEQQVADDMAAEDGR